MTILEYRESIGMSRAEFSRLTGIPIRTLEDWDAGRRNPAPWLTNMIIEYIKMRRS